MHAIRLPRTSVASASANADTGWQYPHIIFISTDQSEKIRQK